MRGLWSPLHMAALHGGDATLLRHLIAAGGGGARLDAATASGRTPLHFAARSGNGRAITALLAAGADPLAADQHGILPVDYADSFSKGVTEMLKAATVEAMSAKFKAEAVLSAAAAAAALAVSSAPSSSSSSSSSSCVAAVAAAASAAPPLPSAPALPQPQAARGRTLFAEGIIAPLPRHHLPDGCTYQVRFADHTFRTCATRAEAGGV
jgi:hypothetical protein